MKKYQDIVLDNTGNSILSATITVTDNPGGSVSTIFSDDGVTAQANPFTGSGTDGAYSFYAANGNYDITITKTGFDTEQLTDIYLFDGVNTPKFMDTVADMAASTSLVIGDLVETSGYHIKGDGGDNRYEIVAALTGTDDSGSFIDLDTLQAKAIFPNWIYNITQWGAKTDGTNVYTALNNASTFLKNTGKTLYCNSGNYTYDTDSGTIELEGFSLVGPGTYSAITPTSWGAVLSITGTTNEAISLGRGGQIHGVNFYYPDQVTTNPPTAYPFTILFDYSLSAVNSGNVQGVVIEDCTFFNSYRGIDVGPQGTGTSQGNARIRNNRFYTLLIGIFVQDTLTNLYITDNTWSPEFWLDSAGQDVRTYVALNGKVVNYIEGDNMYFTNNSMFAYGYGIFYSGGSSNVIFQIISNNIFDSVRRGIYATGGSVPQGTNINSNMFAAKNFGDATDYNCKCIFISDVTDVLKLIISGNRFGPTAGNHIQIDDSTGTQTGMVTLDNNQYEFAGFGDATSTNYFSQSINAASVDFIITDSHYRQTNRTDNIGTKVFDAQSLTIVNNKYDSCDQAVVVDACDYLVLTGNWSRNTHDTTASYSIGTITTDAIDGPNQFDKQPNLPKITADSATPSVANGELFGEAYTTPTDITGFTNFRKGKTIKIFFNTGNCVFRFDTTATLKGNSNASWTTVAGDWVEITYDGTNYYCTVNDAT